MTRELRLALCIVALPLSLAAAQKAPVAFGFYIENDTFAPPGSDSGYTNGIRLSWSIMSVRPGMRFFADYNVAQVFRLWPLRGLGLLPRNVDGACDASGERARRKVNVFRNRRTGRDTVFGGACMILNLGIAQSMYTPDTLASTIVIPSQRPYAGFLYTNVGVTTLDSPSATNPNHWVRFTEISNQVILGITGQGAHAEDTQSLAHWTWSPAAHRPMGWGTQLRQQVQVALLSDIQFRTRGMEACTNGCTGMETEGRWFDVTPHLESVVGTYMVRFSGGFTARLGAHFPDAVGTLRIPTTVPFGPGSKRCFVCERMWYYGFISADTRGVAHNMFISGGIVDDGPTGWRTIRQITPRRGVHEVAGGLAVGHSKFTLRGQLAWRTAEYDVIGRGRTNGWHGYGSLLLAVHGRAD